MFGVTRYFHPAPGKQQTCILLILQISAFKRNKTHIFLVVIALSEVAYAKVCQFYTVSVNPPATFFSFAAFSVTQRRGTCLHSTKHQCHISHSGFFPPQNFPFVHHYFWGRGMCQLDIFCIYNIVQIVVAFQKTQKSDGILKQFSPAAMTDSSATKKPPLYTKYLKASLQLLEKRCNFDQMPRKTGRTQSVSHLSHPTAVWTTVVTN